MTNVHLKQEIISVIERQLRDGDPPETHKTLDRLLAAGYSRERAMELMGAALLEEIWWMMSEQRDFDRDHFRSLLDRVG
jgi:hypothetical protein